MTRESVYIFAVIGAIVSTAWSVLKYIRRAKEGFSQPSNAAEIIFLTIISSYLLSYAICYLSIGVFKDLDMVVNGDRYEATVVSSEEPHWEQMKPTGNLTRAEFITKEGETRDYSFISSKEATTMPMVGDVYTIYYNSDNSSMLEVNWINTVLFLVQLMGVVVGLVALRLVIKFSVGRVNYERLVFGIKVFYGVVLLFSFGVFYVFYKMESQGKWVIFIIGSIIVVVAVLVLRSLSKFTNKESIISSNVLDETRFNSKK